jgi:hypothetical protein
MRAGAAARGIALSLIACVAACTPAPPMPDPPPGHPASPQTEAAPVPPPSTTLSIDRQVPAQLRPANPPAETPAHHGHGRRR